MTADYHELNPDGMTSYKGQMVRRGDLPAIKAAEAQTAALMAVVGTEKQLYHADTIESGVPGAGTIVPPDTRMLDAALEYASRMYPVFPLHRPGAGGICTCGKIPCPDAGKHPRTLHGKDDATTDKDQIRQWWKPGQQWNIGLVTGEKAGLLVLDVDKDKGGFDSLNALELKYQKLPETLLIKTGGGGLHFYFAYPRGAKIKSGTEVLGPGLDIKAEGGYIVAPPSLHKSGNEYAVLREALPLDAPSWFLALLGSNGSGSKAPAPPVPEKIIDGSRHSWLVSLAGTMRRRGMTEESIFSALMAENLARCVPPMGEDEVRSIAASSMQWTPTAPPGVPAIPTATVDALPDVVRKYNPVLEVRLTPGHFITEYMDIQTSRSDAYPEYHFGMALALLSIVCDRQAVMRFEYGNIFPNVWICCLGLTSVSRKTTAINAGSAIIDSVMPGIKLPEAFSPEGFIEEMAEKPHAYLIQDEAAAMLSAMSKPYMGEMRDLFCLLFDGKDYHRKLRTGKKSEKTSFDINGPYLTMVLGTTPERFKETTQIIDIQSGWLLRFAYLHPDYPKEWKPPQKINKDLVPRSMALARRVQDLADLFKNQPHYIEFELSEDALAAFTAWLKRREVDLIDSADESKSAMFSRLQATALKFSMLFTIGGRSFIDEAKAGGIVTVHTPYMAEAIRLVDEYFEPVGLAVMKLVEQNRVGNNQDKIVDLVKRHGRIKHMDLMRAMHISKRDLNEAIEALLESEEIAAASVSTGGRPAIWYSINHTD
ncbi:MAG: bifunctional DNA primase/polymerase [bacterium]